MLRLIKPSIILFFIFTVVSWPALGSQDSTNSRIRITVSSYLQKIFGEAAPTLSDFYQFENSHSEWESDLEDKYCIERWGKIQAGECLSWLAERNNNLKHSDSLFYVQVRKIVKIRYKNSSIKKINCKENASGDDCIIEVLDRESGNSIKLRLVNDPRLPDLAYLRIIEIVGKPTKEYIVK